MELSGWGRATTVRVVQACVMLCGATTGCSSSSSSPTASPATPTVVECGPGPYVNFTAHVGEATAIGDPRPKEGVKLTVALCPDKPFTADSHAVISGKMTRGVPLFLTAEHPDDIPSTYGEFQIESDFEGPLVVIPNLFRYVVGSDFGPDKVIGVFGVALPSGTLDGGTTADPCTQLDGVSFSIPDHPEAKVVYFAADVPVPKPDPSLTATSISGLAQVTGLADGVSFSPVATKPGCGLVSAYGGFTGRAAVKKGFALLFTFEMRK